MRVDLVERAASLILLNWLRAWKSSEHADEHCETLKLSRSFALSCKRDLVSLAEAKCD